MRKVQPWFCMTKVLDTFNNPTGNIFIRSIHKASPTIPMKLPIAGVNNVILVASGKGGVGKSTIASNLSIALSKKYTVGLLDADVYGPSVPMMMNLSAVPSINHKNLILPLTNYNVKCMSMGLLVDEKSPVVWRGLMVMQAIRKLLRGVVWGPLDILVVDMPPGTGDTQLSITQEMPIQGVVMVTTPQDVAISDCVKGAEMFKKVDVPVIGVIENMSFFTCSECETYHHIFGDNLANKIKDSINAPIIGRLPIKPSISDNCDKGIPSVITDFEISAIFHEIVESISSYLQWHDD